MNGTLYAVGVGPGDPELMTLKAVKILAQADVIACPAKDAAPGVAYEIAAQACPQLRAKEVLPLTFPMGRGDAASAHREAASRVISALQSGKTVAFVTLGDPCFYSTFFYIADAVRAAGFAMEIVSGVPSFCAVLSKLQLPAALAQEPVMIRAGTYCDFDGTQIILKAGSRLKALKQQAAEAGRQAFLVENCGLPDEKVYPELAAIPDEAGYFSILIVK